MKAQLLRQLPPQSLPHRLLNLRSNFYFNVICSTMRFAMKPPGKLGRFLYINETDLPVLGAAFDVAIQNGADHR